MNLILTVLIIVGGILTYNYMENKEKDKNFMKWLSEERIVMYEWSLDAQGISIDERFKILVETYDLENKC